MSATANDPWHDSGATLKAIGLSTLDPLNTVILLADRADAPYTSLFLTNKGCF